MVDGRPANLTSCAHGRSCPVVPVFFVETLPHLRHPTDAMETIVALAGRRIDPPNAGTERFPSRNIERVRRDICQELKNHRARWLVSSAAAGADLLAITAAINLGITSRLVLSPGVRALDPMSVEDRE